MKKGYIVIGLVVLLLSVGSGYHDLLGSAEAQCCQCTAYAKSRRPDITSLIPGAGAAKNWPQAMRDNGYPELVSTTPLAGALVVFQPRVHFADASAGHIAYVESKNADGTFNITEQGVPSCSCIVNTRSNLTVEPGVEFLYGLSDLGPSLVLGNEMVVYPNPVPTRDHISFIFSIQNTGGNTLSMAEIFVRAYTPSGIEWKVWATPQDIAAGEAKSFTTSAAVSDEIGIWTIDKIEIKDTSERWYNLDKNGYSYSLFVVGSTNVARGANVAASVHSGSGNYKEHLVDGNLGTRWESEWDDGQTVQLDLGQPTAMDTIILRWERAYASEYRVELKTGVGEVYYTANGQGGTTRIDFPLHSQRFIKLELLQRPYNDWGFSLWEIEAYCLACGMGGTDGPVDTNPPSCGFGDTPATAHWDMVIPVEITDDLSGVAGANLHVRPQGGEFIAVPMHSVGGDMWEATVNVLSYPHGTVLEYLAHAWDYAGNSQQITGVENTTVDHEAPAGHFASTPDIVGQYLPIQAQVNDESGVALVELHVRPQGSGFTTHAMTYNSGNGLWEISLPIGSYPLGTVLEYLVHAGDTVGNSGQVTGLDSVTVSDHEIPVGHYVVVDERPFWDLIVQVDFEDDLSGVVNANLHYRINGGGFQVIPMNHIYGNHWERGIHVDPYDHGTLIEYLVHACDNAGNCGQVTGLQPSIVVCQQGMSPNDWCAEYYNNTSLAGSPATILTEGNTYINRNYGLGGPGGTGLGAGNFSIRWAKRAWFPAGNRVFHSRSDDGVRVKVDGNMIINSFVPGGNQNHYATRHLTEGEHQVVFEYVEYGGWAYVQLTW